MLKLIFDKSLAFKYKTNSSNFSGASLSITFIKSRDNLYSESLNFILIGCIFNSVFTSFSNSILNESLTFLVLSKSVSFGSTITKVPLLLASIWSGTAYDTSSVNSIVSICGSLENNTGLGVLSTGSSIFNLISILSNSDCSFILVNLLKLGGITRILVLLSKTSLVKIIPFKSPKYTSVTFSRLVPSTKRCLSGNLG